MFNNPGKKLKVVAWIVFVVMTIASVVLAIVLGVKRTLRLTEIIPEYFLTFLIGGPILSYIIALILYTKGDTNERVNDIWDKYKQIDILKLKSAINTRTTEARTAETRAPEARAAAAPSSGVNAFNVRSDRKDEDVGNEREVKPSPNAKVDSRLLGRWYDANGAVLNINADGSADYDGAPFECAARDGTLRWKENSKTYDCTYKLENGIFKLKFDSYDRKFCFSRHIENRNNETPSKEQAGGGLDGWIACPNCGKLQKSGKPVCWNCGVSFDNEMPVKSSAPATAERPSFRTYFHRMKQPVNNAEEARPIIQETKTYMWRSFIAALLLLVAAVLLSKFVLSALGVIFGIIAFAVFLFGCFFLFALNSMNTIVKKIKNMTCDGCKATLEPDDCTSYKELSREWQLADSPDGYSKCYVEVSFTFKCPKCGDVKTFIDRICSGSLKGVHEFNKNEFVNDKVVEKLVNDYVHGTFHA